MDAANNITQPPPEITGFKKIKRLNTQPGRKINRPCVGVVQVPYISKTPLADTLSIKEKENPHMKYKIVLNKKKSDVRFSSFVSLSVIGCAFYSLMKIFKK